MKDIKIPDGIFFDWDGTLADTYNFLNDAHNHILSALGLPLFKDGEYKKYFGMPRDILYPAIYKDKHDEAKALFEKYVFNNSDKIKPKAGANEILQLLESHNIVMGIISNKKAIFLHHEIKNFGWEKYFSVVVGAGDASKDKPSSAPLIYALDKVDMDVSKHNIWYVGDTENDLACAKEAGAKAVFIKGHEPPEPLISAYNPMLYAENCIELHKILVAILTKYSKRGK